MSIELSSDPISPPAPVRPAWATVAAALRVDGAIRFVGRHGFAFADQVLISGSNFAVMLVCARALQPAQFGQFALVHTAVLLLASLQSALITQPHGVLAAARLERGEYRAFTGSMLVLQMLMCGLVMLLTLGAALAARTFDFSATPFADLLLGAAVLAVGWQLQEFARRVLYTERRYAAALANDVVAYGVQPLLLGAMWHQGMLSASSGTAAGRWSAPALAMTAMGLGYALAAAHGMWLVRDSVRLRLRPADVRDSWRFGSWLACAECVNWFSSFAMYQYAAGILLGPAASGALKAAQVVFGPARIVSFFLCNVLPVQFSRTLAERGPRAMHAQLRRAMLALAPVSASYCLAIALFAAPLLRLLYGSQKYESDSLVLSLFAVASCLGNLLMALAAALTARRLTRQLFWAYVAAGAVAVPLAIIGIRLWQVPGAVAALIAADLLVGALFWRIYAAARRRDDRDASA